MSDQFHPYSRHGKSLVLALLVMLLGSIILVWTWNGIAIELLSMPTMKFKHALALELSLFSIASVFPLTWRLLSGRML